MTHFVFCHGFGFNSHFWDPLTPYFSREKYSLIDLGYFKHQLQTVDLQGQKIVGIGHSIGLSKLAGMYQNFDCLVGLNGFMDFLGLEQAAHKRRKRELNVLRQSFLKYPTSMLKNFYARCGVPEFADHVDYSNLDHDLISSDFEWLEKKHDLPEVQTLILGSDNDVVVPEAIVFDNFSKKSNVKIDVIMDAGHGLGFRKPLEVHKKIMSFLDGNVY